MFGHSRRRLTAEETAANAAARAERDKVAMTCQCCGRKIQANTGPIAHHGYERPDIGYQTSSCMGARHDPFEFSRDRLGVMITALRSQLSGLRFTRRGVQKEEFPLSVTYRNYRVPTGAKPNDVTVHVTRDNFDAVRKLHEQAFTRQSLHRFDVVKERKLAELHQRIVSLIRFIREQQKRYDGWKRTHQWRADAWHHVGSRAHQSPKG